jgi:hypothetical protein
MPSMFPAALLRPGQWSVRRSLLLTVLAGALVPGICLASAVPASAATLPKSLAPFANCPVNKPHVTACLYSTVTSGSFQIGSTTLDITSPLTVNLGLVNNPDGAFSTVAPDNGTPALQGAPIPVPILSLPPLPGPLSITATTNLVSLPSVSLIALQTGEGTALDLPIDVSINNVLIGSGCTIGSTSNPIVINLTTGATDPPPPNQPISGTPGTGSANKKGVITISGTALVDNAFAVPGASGCGLFGILDPALDLVAGLPSAAGHNSAVLHATSGLASASLIKKYLG